jgi:hypothetical protein
MRPPPDFARTQSGLQDCEGAAEPIYRWKQADRINAAIAWEALMRLRAPVLAVPVLATLVGAGCIMQGIPGLLGVNWGDDAAVVVGRIGVTCKEWLAWVGGEGIEVCSDIDHPVQAFGEAAFVQIFRRAAPVVGLQLQYAQCEADKWQRLQIAIAKELGASTAGTTIYTVYGDGSVAYAARDRRDDTCTVTAAGPDFGPAFQAYQLMLGLGELADSLRPH